MTLSFSKMAKGIKRVPSAEEINRLITPAKWAEMVKLEKSLLDLFPEIYEDQMKKKFPTNLSIQKDWVSIPESAVSFHKTPLNNERKELFINTLSLNNGSESETNRAEDDAIYVLLHGYASSIAKWTPLLCQLTETRVYCFDWLGWGLSSRVDFRTLMTEHESANQTVDIWCKSLVSWLHAMDLTGKKVTLVGHSMGAYLGLMLVKGISEQRYDLNCIKRMVCLSPVGLVVNPPTFPSPNLHKTAQSSPKSNFLEGKEIEEEKKPTSLIFTHGLPAKDLAQNLLFQIFWNNTPHRVLQLISPEQAKSLLQLINTSSHSGYPGRLGKHAQDISIDYTYSVSTGPESGETAFKNLAYWQGNRIVWDRPVGDWLIKSKVNIDLDFVYGEYDWTDMSFAWENLRNLPNTRLFAIEDVGHHLYSVKPAAVAEVIKNNSSATMNDRIVSKWRDHYIKSIKSEQTSKALKHTFLSWFA